MHPDKFRGLPLLKALMALPTFSRDRSVREQIHGLERVADEYQMVTGRQPGEDVMLGTLVRCLPNAIKQHVQLQMADTSTYQSVRDYVLGYELTTTSWTPAKMHQAFGVVPMPSTADQGKRGHYANECWDPRVQQVQSQPCAGADGCPGDLPAAKQVISAKDTVCQFHVHKVLNQAKATEACGRFETQDFWLPYEPRGSRSWRWESLESVTQAKCFPEQRDNRSATMLPPCRPGKPCHAATAALDRAGVEGKMALALLQL
ncbi:hypothetical protein AK812_SmicGene29103 [Symbiodinium microadriaticum]|uniref:Uncharacterized protein n=1 Tax=Symbiodinium microadriaticum TaxID=2951 RepID=A0A1Q9D2P8_SYMMI|nr:hypothetical protein AK812_SmicGene29103 [Symbiodinium microadriaticum]CAE7211814.1 unnamed protein product [Symbiodinium microadriaticum]CAE7243776.1 unnamed protein product [Symbiodinium sp. KB8]